MNAISILRAHKKLSLVGWLNDTSRHFAQKLTYIMVGYVIPSVIFTTLT